MIKIKNLRLKNSVWWQVKNGSQFHYGLFSTEKHSIKRLLAKEVKIITLRIGNYTDIGLWFNHYEFGWTITNPGKYYQAIVHKSMPIMQLLL